MDIFSKLRQFLKLIVDEVIKIQFNLDLIQVQSSRFQVCLHLESAVFTKILTHYANIISYLGQNQSLLTVQNELCWVCSIVKMAKCNHDF